MRTAHSDSDSSEGRLASLTKESIAGKRVDQAQRGNASPAVTKASRRGPTPSPSATTAIQPVPSQLDSFPNLKPTSTRTSRRRKAGSSTTASSSSVDCSASDQPNSKIIINASDYPALTPAQIRQAAIKGATKASKKAIKAKRRAKKAALASQSDRQSENQPFRDRLGDNHKSPSNQAASSIAPVPVRSLSREHHPAITSIDEDGSETETDSPGSNRQARNNDKYDDDEDTFERSSLSDGSGELLSLDALSLEDDAKSLSSASTNSSSSMSSEEANSIIESLLSNECGFVAVAGNKLRLWQALCIEFGCCEVELPDLPRATQSTSIASNATHIRSSTSRPPLPQTLNQARTILKQSAHINLNDYLRERQKRDTSNCTTRNYAYLNHPSASSMMKYTRKTRKFVDLGTVKEEFLQPLLKDFGIKRSRGVTTK